MYIYNSILFNVNHDANRFIKISVVGDISLSHHINQAIHNEFNSNFMDFVSGFSDITKKDDLTFANLECSISNHSHIPWTAYNKQFINPKARPPIIQLCSPQININLLESASIDVVTIANNHIFDCTQYGILDTINTLELNDNIDYVGIGDVLHHKQRIIIKQLYNVKVGMLGFYAVKRWFDPNNKLKHKKNTTNELNIDATPSFIDEYRAKYFLCKDLRYYKNVLKVDLLMVYIHWLEEYIYFEDLASNKQYIPYHNLAHALSECGVDVIIGSHPHVLIQPQWIVNKQNDKTLILWSLGNFVFDSSRRINRTHKTCLAQLLIDKNTKKISNIRFREGYISNNPTFQTVLAADWKESFCKSHL